MNPRRKSSTIMEEKWNPLNTVTASESVSMNNSELYFQSASIQLDKQLVKIELVLTDWSDNQDQLACCSSENISQAIKTEHCYKDKDEELFSLANFAESFESSSLTQCTYDDTHTTFSNRNRDLTPHREKQKG